MVPLSILVVDDDLDQLTLMEIYLSKQGHEVFVAGSGPAGFEIVREHLVDLVLSDYRMPDWDGEEVLQRVKQLNPDIDVVLMTAYGNVENAVKAMKSGAYSYLAKPVDFDELDSLLERIQERRALVAENRMLKHALQKKFKFDAIVSQSGLMEEVLSTAARAAPSKATVLIRGESGTGKELIAHAIHHASPRNDKPFVVVNVAALAENLLESELFGHEKGAYTGAMQRRIGRFEQADGGTLFIDEVGEMPLPVQVKLLRSIQFGQVERLGGNQTLSIDVRIIAATHRNLEAMLQENTFRSDLYYRLNVVSILMPPLRRRKLDIRPLIDHFIQKYGAENQKPVKGITREALDRLMKYDYPGNVRELENIIERAVVLCRGDHVTKTDLPPQVEAHSVRSILDPHNLADGYEAKLHAFERAIILEALQQCKGNQSAAARALEMSERHIRSRMEKLGLKAHRT